MYKAAEHNKNPLQMDYVKQDFVFHFYTGAPDQLPALWKFRAITATAKNRDEAIEIFFKKLSSYTGHKYSTSLEYFLLRQINQYVISNKELHDKIPLAGLTLIARHINNKMTWETLEFVESAPQPVMDLLIELS